MEFDVVIIGGGPAGLTAAIYSSRRALKTLVLTRDIGGQAAQTFEIENYPGFEKTSGIDLAMKMRAQAEKFGAELRFEDVKKIEKNNDGLTIKTAAGEYTCQAIILAFGKTPRKLNVPGEEEFAGRGVSYCATCDAPFFKNKTVVVNGGGNSAVDAALYLSKICKKVYLVHRRESLAAVPLLLDRLNESKNIEKVLGEEIIEIKGDQVVNKIILKNKSIEADGIFIEIGFTVDRSLVEGLVDLNEGHQIIIDQIQKTSVPGIFAAGDLTITPYKQIIVAAGEGAKAALSAYDFIQNKAGKKGVLADWH